MQTLLLSLLHFLVQLLSGLALSARFASEGMTGLQFLLFVLCALGLELPLGYVKAALARKSEKWPVSVDFLFSAGGFVLAVLGSVIHPAVLGLGYAMFTVSAADAVMREDSLRSRKSFGPAAFLGVTALGFAAGQSLSGSFTAVFAAAAGLGLAILAALYFLCIKGREQKEPEELLARLSELRNRDLKFDFRSRVIGMNCAMVVLLRSYVGFRVKPAWQAEEGMLLLSAAVIFAGTLLGGAVAGIIGRGRVIVYSFAAAEVCFLRASNLYWGLGALLFFNMSLPVLYEILCERFPEHRPLALGVLGTLGFAAYLPVYFKASVVLDDLLVAGIFCLVALLLLISAQLENEKKFDASGQEIRGEEKSVMRESWRKKHPDKSKSKDGRKVIRLDGFDVSKKL